MRPNYDAKHDVRGARLRQLEFYSQEDSIDHELTEFNQQSSNFHFNEKKSKEIIYFSLGLLKNIKFSRNYFDYHYSYSS